MVDFSPKDRSNHQINTQLSTHPTPTAGGEAQRPTRRNFVVWYLGGLLAAMTAALLAPLLVYLWPTGSQVKATDVKVTIPQPLDELAEGGSLQFNAPANYGFKMIDGGGDNYPGKVSFGAYAIKTAGQILLLSVTCSHLGCSVQYSDQEKKFTCPCHGSEFNGQGQVIHGPATAGLSHYGWKPGGKPTELLIQGYSLQGIG